MKSWMVINMFNSIYEQMVLNNPKFDENQGIAFRCIVDAECYGFENDDEYHEDWAGRCVRHFHIIMLKRHQIYTHVSDEFNNNIPTTGWKNTTNHNSCWRNGWDELTRLGFSCWNEAFSNCPKEYRNPNKDAGLLISIGFGMCNSTMFKFVEVEKEVNQDNDYFYNITNVKEIKKTLKLG